jgi:hypothetical protein
MFAMSKAWVALALLSAAGGGLFWFSTWELECGHVGAALIAASSIASILYVPCFCFHLYETRSIRESLLRGFEFWLEAFFEILNLLS